MTQADRDRVVALKKAGKKLIAQREAAAELELSVRQVRRLLKKLEQPGDKAVVHGLKIANRLSTTPGAIAEMAAAVDLKPLVAGRKLDQEVDRLLAAEDRQFSTYLAQRQARAADPDPGKRWSSASAQKYLDTKRAEWWKARVAKMSVVLNDGSLAARCGLAQIGVRINAR